MKCSYSFFVFIIIACLLTTSCAPKKPLIEAVTKGDSIAVKNLVKEGAKINEIDSSGTTPLIYAIRSGNIEIAKTVLSLGADANQKDKYGKNPMYYATSEWHHNMTKLLFLANKAIEKGGTEEVIKLCRDFQEDSIVIPKGRPLYEGYLNYRYLNPKISYRGNKKLSIVVRDKRPYILSKEKKVDYVGLWRERGVIRPHTYDIGTLSGRPFADDLTFCISTALNDAGFLIKKDFDQEKSKLPNTKEEPVFSNVDRIVYIEIQEWITDTFAATGLWYDIKLDIFDGKNVLLGTTHFKSDENLGGESHQSFYDVVPTATENILSKMLNVPDIQAALKD